MSSIARVRALWSGFVGAPGYTTLYFDASSTPPPTAAMRSWFQGMNSVLPSVVTIQVPGTGDLLESSTGVIIGTWTTAVPAAVTGVGAGVYAAPSGLITNFATGSVIAGRRLRGRSFIVPINGTMYDSNGTLSAPALAAMSATNGTFLTAVASSLIVWHRPVGGAGGDFGAVTAITTPDKTCVLRSRRD